MQILAFINQKGGVGKTTLAVNLARTLSLMDYKVLLIDFDPQANAGSGLGIKVSKEKSIYQALIEGEVEKFIQNPFPSLYLLPSSIDLVGLEVELVNFPKREYLLKNLIIQSSYQGKTLKDFFDFIFIDSPPSLSLITINILCTVEGIIIPLQCEYYALEGLSLLIKTIRGLKQKLNPELQLFGLVLTMYDSRNRLSKAIAEEVQNHFKWILFKTYIPRSIKVSEAQSFGKSILDYELRNKVSWAFYKLAEEFLEKVNSYRKNSMV